MKDIEHHIQKAIANYLDLLGLCYFAVPNGGQRHVRVAAKLKAEGVKAGVPDIAIVHEGKYYGLEVKKPKTDKSPKGRLSDSQKIMIPKLEAAGAQVGVVYGMDDVTLQLRKWGMIR